MSQRNNARTRQRQLAWLGTAAGVISLAGAGWYWYNHWSNNQPGAGETSASSKGTSSAATMSNRPRPSLSIHLSPSISVDELKDLQRITALYEQLAHLYLIHLIHDGAHGAHPSSHLDKSLSHIEHSDTRRILAYSQHNGGIAITRALGCEAHLHVLTSDVADEDELSTSLQLILKNPTLRLLVIAVVPPRDPSSSSQLDIDSVLTSLKEVHSTAHVSTALRVVDLRGDKSTWHTQLGGRMVEYRRAWR